MIRRSVGANRLLCGAFLVLAAALPDARAQDSYPNRVIRIIVPTAPGGPSDISARMIAQELSKRWGRQVVVETRPGAGTIIGSEIVAKAPPDGYTLLVSPSTLAINPATYKKMPYDALRDFAPITQSLFGGKGCQEPLLSSHRGRPRVPDHRFLTPFRLTPAFAGRRVGD